MIWLLTAVAVFALLNFVTIRALLGFHPRWRRLTLAAAILGNLLWPMLPFILSARTNPLFRILRATLGPVWFSWLIFIVVYSAFVALIGLIRLSVARQRPFAEFGSRPSSAYLALLLIVALTGMYQALVPLRVERVTVKVPSLPSELAGYRIALLSDLHVGLFTRPGRLRRITETAGAERPEIVAIAGDFIDDDPFFVPKLIDGLSAIPESIPIVAVLGNHEIYGDPDEVVRKMTGSRVTLLVNRGIAAGRGAATIWLAGLSDFAASRRSRADLAPDLDRAMSGSVAGTPTILLAHQPNAFALARQRGIELTIVGHTHGGQFGIRPLRWSLAGLFLPFDMGLYRRDRSQLYVTTGAGYWLVPFRLGMSPEIVIIELSAGT